MITSTHTHNNSYFVPIMYYKSILYTCVNVRREPSLFYCCVNVDFESVNKDYNYIFY